MPKLEYKEAYSCEYCGETYETLSEAENCEKTHNIIYIPIAVADLKRLISFIVSGNPDWLVGTSIIGTLMKYNKLGGVDGP